VSDNSNKRRGLPDWMYSVMLLVLLLFVPLLPVSQAYVLYYAPISPNPSNHLWASGILIVLDLIGFVYILRYYITMKIMSALGFGFMIMISYISTMILSFANIYKTLGLNDHGEPVHRANDFLYFSIVTWTTVGSSPKAV
jgi:hypothetical protein